jgi:hypothetical protein
VIEVGKMPRSPKKHHFRSGRAPRRHLVNLIQFATPTPQLSAHKSLRSLVQQNLIANFLQYAFDEFL